MFGDSCSVPLLLFLCTLNKSSSFILSLQIIFLNLWSFLLLHSELFSFSPHFTKCAFPRTALWAHPVLNRGILRSLMIFFFWLMYLKWICLFLLTTWILLIPSQFDLIYSPIPIPAIIAAWRSLPFMHHSTAFLPSLVWYSALFEICSSFWLEIELDK